MTLVRTAFSTSRTARPAIFSAGLFDAEARMMAQAVTRNAGPRQRHGRKRRPFRRPLRAAGDARGRRLPDERPFGLARAILHDITVVTPVFRLRAGISAIFACTAHVVDIGGRGFGPDGAGGLRGGLLIPITKFAQAGQVQPLLIEMIRANVRTPDQTVGDIHSLAACKRGGRAAASRDDGRVRDRRSVGPERPYPRHLRARPRGRAIETVPDGVYRNEMRGSTAMTRRWTWW